MNADIRAAFETRLAAFAAAQTPPLTVAWENSQFTPVSGEAWLYGSMHPAPTQNPTFGPKHDRLVGFYQINVYGIEDSGPADAEAVADAIIALFPRGSMSQNGTIINLDTTGSRAQGLNDVNGFFFIPVRIRYRQDVLG